MDYMILGAKQREKEIEFMRIIISGIAASILFLVFMYLMYLKTIALAEVSSTEYITIACLCIFFVLATRLDDITKFEFGAKGIAAELKKTLAEAQATLDQLHHVAETLGQISVAQISMSNRMDGFTPTAKREYIERLVDSLLAIGLSPPRVQSVKNIAKPFDDFDYFYWILRPIMHAGSPRNNAAIEEFKGQYSVRGIGTNPTSDILEDFLVRMDWLKGEVAERLADWKHFNTTGEHRRLAQWEARHSAKIDEYSDPFRDPS